VGADVGTLQICGVTSPPRRYHAGITPLDRSGASFDTPNMEIDVLGPVRVACSDARLGHRGVARVPDINRTRAGTHPNTRRESTDFETSGLNRSNTQTWCAARDLNPEPAD
jgi:hypothetical protein